MAAAREIVGHKHILILSAGTDGTDGPTDAAGAMCDGGTVTRAAAKGIDSLAFLENNDAYHFFQQLGDGALFSSRPPRPRANSVRGPSPDLPPQASKLTGTNDVWQGSWSPAPLALMLQMWLF